MLARGALVILSLLSRDFGRKLMGAGLLSGALVSSVTCVKLAFSEQHWWCMGQREEIHSGRRLGSDHAKDPDMYKEL